MKSIALILPYFGNLNRSGYFELFLESCKNNPTIDFLIYTDDRTQYDYSKNVKVKYTTFEGLKEKIQRLYEFPININHAYKLCDYKVAYGEIFADDIKNYDFWGYMDCDLIFGDIRKFLTDEKLGKYQKLYTRGHLTLYRNTPENNARYRKRIEGGYNTDYKRAFSSEGTCAIDEWGKAGGINRIFMKDNIPIYDELDFDDIKVEAIPFIPVQRCKNSPHSSMRNIYYAYDGKKLTRVCQFFDEIFHEEVLYVHLQKRKMENHVDDLREFIIIPNSFEPFRELSFEEHNLLPKDKSKVEHIITRGMNAVKKKLPKIEKGKR